jgi:type 1 glutamine amidotransferase
MVFYQQGKWTPERAKDLDAYLARGGGLVYIHYAVDGGQDAPGFAQRIGLAWKGGASKFRHGELELGFDPAQDHPIARNFETLELHDESYWQLLGDPDRIDLLATGKEEGKDQPLFWTLQPSKGRVFVSIPGHFSWTFDDPLFRILLPLSATTVTSAICLPARSITVNSSPLSMCRSSCRGGNQVSVGAKKPPAPSYQVLNSRNPRLTNPTRGAGAFMGRLW